MPVAFCKSTYSSKLVLKDVVEGSPKVSRVPVAPPSIFDNDAKLVIIYSKNL